MLGLGTTGIIRQYINKRRIPIYYGELFVNTKRTTQNVFWPANSIFIRIKIKEWSKSCYSFNQL